jgi:prepilin-type N-terminal cleavage/methylation domain-containing protein
MINNTAKKIGAAGFTLMETLVAVLLLSIAVAGPLTIASKGIQATTLAKDQDTAFYLAQDAVEYIRFVRDTNRLSNGNWLTGPGGADLTPCVSSTGNNTCQVDSLKNTITSCSTSGGSCGVINWDSTNLYFSYTSGTATIFSRTVSIVTPTCNSGGTLCNNGEASVTVKVTWCDQASVCATTPRAVTVRENIFNWQ